MNYIRIQYSLESNRNLSENNRYDDSPVSNASESYFVAAVTLTIFTVSIDKVVEHFVVNWKISNNAFSSNEAKKRWGKVFFLIFRKFENVRI